MYFGLAFLPAIAVVGSVASQSKTVSTFAQMGSVVSRTENEIDGVAQGDKSREKALEASKALIEDKDKLVFTLSAINIGITCFLFGRAPEHFWIWHTPKVIVLTFIRWLTFKGEGKHYLLYDFCYWANALSVLYCTVLPTNATCFQVLFVAANGPLAWSILAFQQSLVLHSLQHMISVFIHTSPMLLTLGLRWIDSPEKHGYSVEDEGGAAPMPVMLVARGVAYLYLPWVLIYYTWVFVLMAERIQSRGYSTLFDRVTGMTIGKKLEGIQDDTKHKLIRKAVYLVSHLCFGAVTMFFAALMYYNHAAHFLFAVCILSASAWNGAGFYGKVWATKYHKQVMEAAEDMLRQQEMVLAASNEKGKDGDVKALAS